MTGPKTKDLTVQVEERTVLQKTEIIYVRVVDSVTVGIIYAKENLVKVVILREKKGWIQSRKKGRSV